MARRAFLALLLLLAPLAAPAVPGNDLVITQRGDLPILLTAPHGGELPVPGARMRTQGKYVRDLHTLQLAEAVADRVAETAHARPYLVAARFDRKYIDANRGLPEAYQDPASKPPYDAYHAAVREYVDEIRARFGRGILLDIHGQGAAAGAIFRGTRNGVTDAALLKAQGMAAVTGPSGILGWLEAKGYRVLPNAAAGQGKETPDYLGGYTVFTYGSNTADGIDAIQLELGRNLRESVTFPADLAAAIVAFRTAYLPAQPLAARKAAAKP